MAGGRLTTTATAITDGVQLNWQPVSGATGYQIWSTAAWPDPIPNLPYLTLTQFSGSPVLTVGQVTQADVTGLIPGATASYAVVPLFGGTPGDMQNELVQATAGSTDTNCTAPAITSADSATATAGTPFNFVVTTCSTSVPVIKGSGLPKGLSLVNKGDGTATISGTPDAHDSGSYTATITASVKHQPVATQKLLVTVDNAPLFKSKSTDLVHTGTSFSYPITTLHGYPLPSITSSPLPTGVTLTDLGTGSATLGGTPVTGDGGVHPITITATNGVATVSQSFTLTVYEAPSVVVPTSVSVTDGVGMTPVTVTYSGYPAPKVTATGLPKGLSLVNNLNGTATISGTPGAKDPAGTDTVTIHASSKAGTATQSFPVTISP